MTPARAVTGAHGKLGGLEDVRELAGEAVDLVRRWLAEAAGEPVDRPAARLARLVGDPRGLTFAVGFVDGVIRPEDPAVAARRLRELAHDVPRAVPWHLRAGLRAGATAGTVLPGLVVPVVRRVLRAVVGHLVVDASDRRLGRAIAGLRRDGDRLNLNLLGEAVLGDREAARRLAGVQRLLRRDDVDYVSIKVSSIVGPHSPWAFDEAVAEIVGRLAPVYTEAARAVPPKFVNLDMEEYRDLDLTIAVFTTLLDRPELLHATAGIVLQAYLPDAAAAMTGLQAWAARRRARGGAAIRVRIVKGANLPMERVEAMLRGWPLATWATKQETDTSYVRLLELALRPEHVANVRIGVAGHNLFDVAFAWLLAGRRGVREGIELEMLLGMAPAQAAVVRRAAGAVRLYTPVVHPAELDVAIAYLVRRLEEGASRENFLSAMHALHRDDRLFERERQRFLASIDALVLDGAAPPPPHRAQDRRREPGGVPAGGFANAPDTDPSIAANRAWARAALGRATTSQLGRDLVAAAAVTDPAALDAVLARAAGARRSWGRRSGVERAAVLRAAAAELARRRGALVEVMAAECGKTIDQADPEVSEAVDFARWYALGAEELDRVDGARPVPAGPTVVTPPWNFPVSIPAGSTLAALAAGSPVIVKPAPQARRCGALVVDALWAAGVPRDALQLVDVDEADLGRRLVSDPRVDRVILTGSYETARLFRSFRPDLTLLAETSGKNAIVVAPSADMDLAVRDVVASAFGHAGQKCSAASLVILVGSAARSRRFRDQLVDAVSSLRVGHPRDPAAQMGPLIEPPAAKLRRALTELDPGERWLVVPRQLDASGVLWSPGVKEGVRGGSWFHLTECFGPVLGIMTAVTLDAAIELQNAVDYGLTAGLHSLDAGEAARWIERVEAGNLYVNRGITGAIVRRQPFGGWKRSSVGPGAKAGGPNQVLALAGWERAPATAAGAPLDARVRRLLASVDVPPWVERAVASDAAAWAAEYGRVHDTAALGVERNLLRYLPAPVTIRLAGGEPLDALVRVLAAAALAGGPVRVSTAAALPAPLGEALGGLDVEHAVQTEAEWLAAAAAIGAGRVRLIGGDPAALAARTATGPDLAVHAQPVTESGRVELLPFLREQSIAITAHRFGTPVPARL